MNITIKPNNGLQVRKPNGTHLASDGETVIDNPYWRRRLHDGDVVKTTLHSKSKAKVTSKEV